MDHQSVQRRQDLVSKLVGDPPPYGWRSANCCDRPMGTWPLSLSEGDLFHDGVEPLLDGLHNQLNVQDAWLSHQEQQHHRTFGYVLAVSKAKATAVLVWRRIRP